MQKITPYLWFNDQAEEAAEFYIAIFPGSGITDVKRYSEVAWAPGETITIVRFHLDGQHFIAISGGPRFKFTEAISLYVDCKDQAEIDDLSQRLTADGGQEGPRGWIKDKYGMSWQIIPSLVRELLGDPDPDRYGPVMKAILGMQRIDIQGLKDAYNKPA